MIKKVEAKTEAEDILRHWQEEDKEVNGKMYKEDSNMLNVEKPSDVIDDSREGHKSKNESNSIDTFKDGIYEARISNNINCNNNHSNNSDANNNNNNDINATTINNSNEINESFSTNRERNQHEEYSNANKKKICLNEKNEHDRQGENETNAQCAFMHLNGNAESKVITYDNALQNHQVSNMIYDQKRNEDSTNVITAVNTHVEGMLNGDYNGDVVSHFGNLCEGTQQREAVMNTALNRLINTSEPDIMKANGSVGTEETNSGVTNANITSNPLETARTSLELKETTNGEVSFDANFVEMQNTREDLNERRVMPTEHSGSNIIPSAANKKVSDANMILGNLEENVLYHALNKSESILMNDKKEEMEDTNACKKMENAETVVLNKETEQIKETTHGGNGENMQDASLIGTLSSKSNQWSQNETYETAVNNIIEFHKNLNVLNLDRGELYLTESEYVITSHILLDKGFRFFPCEEVSTLPKKRRDSQKKDAWVSEKKALRDGINMGMKEVMLTLQENTEGDGEITIPMNNESGVETNLKEGINAMVSAELMEARGKDEDMSEESKERREAFNEVLNGISNIYPQLLGVEGNFKQLKDKIGDNAFTFSCVVEKMKNNNYGNILYLYNDIYLYFNNLIFLSKPSSKNWMKLHELSIQVTDVIYNVQQKREPQWKERRKALCVDEEKDASTNEASKLELQKNAKDKNENIINEEEKTAFQNLLTQVHQDVHYELYMRFKNKAVWKNAVGGEVELDDQLTDVRVFREMYMWCKKRSRMDGKNVETESSCSEKSY